MAQDPRSQDPVEFNHDADPNHPRTRHIMHLSKNQLRTKVLDLEEELTLARSLKCAGDVTASFLGQRLTEDVSDGLVNEGALAERRDRQTFNARNGIKAAHVSTIVRPENTTWIIERLKAKYGTAEGRRPPFATDVLASRRPALKDMTIIEIGAGIGHFAVELAQVCKHVFAIEADPVFSQTFARSLYADMPKPSNLTWIFDTATPEMSRMGGGWLPAGDLVIVVTGSDEVNLRKLAEHFVHPIWGEVVMPWQDWNNNRAVIDASSDPTKHPPDPEYTRGALGGVIQPVQAYPGVGVGVGVTTVSVASPPEPPDGDRTVLDERVARIIEEVQALAVEALRVRDQDRERVTTLARELQTSRNEVANLRQQILCTQDMLYEEKDKVAALKAENTTLRSDVHWLRLKENHVIASAENKPTFEDS